MGLVRGCRFGILYLDLCVMHPVDTIKTRLQATKAADVAGPEAKRQVGGPSRPLDPLPNVTQPELLGSIGELKELYRGLAGNIVKEAPSSALYLGVYEVAKRFYWPHHYSPTRP